MTPVNRTFEGIRNEIEKPGIAEKNAGDAIIADTSVLIALEKIDLLHILCKIYKEMEA